MANGQEIVSAAVNFLRRYAVLSDSQALVLALWCLHTWVYDKLGRTTAYVELTGVTGSGKTTVMEACSLISRGSLVLNTLRTLAMARYISEHEGRVSLFVDEAERLESGAFGDQRSMLASGYRKGGYHLISVGKETVQFPSWCPKMFTSLKTLTPVLHNRSIPIWLERGTPAARLGLEYERAEATAADIIERFKAVMAATPRFTTVAADWLSSERDQEIWTPLVSLAATLNVSGETMSMLRAASVDLSALRGVERRMDAKVEDDGAKEKSYAVRLIHDVCDVLKEGETAIFSRELVDRLRRLDVAPWRSYQQSGLTELTLAQLLGVFGVEPKNVQVGKGRKDRQLAKGYPVAALREARKGVDVAAGETFVSRKAEARKGGK
jgi:hypothetical protein